MDVLLLNHDRQCCTSRLNGPTPPESPTATVIFLLSVVIDFLLL